jgi:hypothetical protein
MSQAKVSGSIPLRGKLHQRMLGNSEHSHFAIILHSLDKKLPKLSTAALNHRANSRKNTHRVPLMMLLLSYRTRPRLEAQLRHVKVAMICHHQNEATLRSQENVR